MSGQKHSDLPIWRDGQDRYGRVSRWLHWLFFALLLVAVPLGFAGTSLPPGPSLLIVLSVHKSIGVLLLILLAVRVVWRLRQGWPAQLSGPRWMHLSARVAHWGLYALLAAAIASGWAYSSAAGFPPSLFGLFELPSLVAPDKALAERVRHIHHLMVFLLLILVVLHAAAAVYHHVVFKDETLNRMLGRE